MIDRPLWKLLLVAKDEDGLEIRPLTCTECFTILEYLADLVTQAKHPKTMGTLKKAAQEHLNHCPDCHTFYQQKLAELEKTIR